MGVWGQSSQAGVPPLHPLQNFYFAVLVAGVSVVGLSLAGCAQQRTFETDRAQFVQQDLFETDISEASVVTLYLLPDVNLRLRPKLLEELQPGTRIVSHAFDMGDWEPDQVVQVDGRTVYYWVVPEEVPDQLRS
jgi:hypothetical protein